MAHATQGVPFGRKVSQTSAVVGVTDAAQSPVAGAGMGGAGEGVGRGVGQPRMEIASKATPAAMIR